MTIEQFAEVVNFAQKYHKFALWMSDEQVKDRNKIYHNMGKFGAHGLNIKYIDSVYDSRDAKIWCVTFRMGSAGWRFSSNHWNALQPMPKEWRWKTLYDMCMAFLKGEMTDNQVKQFWTELKD